MAGPFHPLIEQWKSITGAIEWSSPPAPEDGAIGFLVPLEIEGVTLSQFALRGKAYGHLPDAALMLQMEIGSDGSRLRTPLVRLDWRPKSPIHKNPDKTRIFGTHVHPFEDNWLDDRQRMRAGNLPWAQNVADFHSFNDALDFAMNLFRIKDIERVPMPEWSMILL